MERIVYNKTLDVHKSGIQFTLRGFETADKMARRIVISLMASGDALDLQTERIDAVMYVTTPGVEGTSINACTISGNTIIYDVLPITEEGITTMQLKIIGARPGGVDGVIATPKFSVEVTKSDAIDDGIEGTVTYTAVEDAIARSKEAYESRLLRIALNSDCMFYAYYADGTIYESDLLKQLFIKGDVLLSQSFAKGGSGTRDGEDTDNSMYYSNVSKSASIETKEAEENAIEILNEVKKHGVYTIFEIDFETGEVNYESPKYDFEIDKETGELKVIGKSYALEENLKLLIADRVPVKDGYVFVKDGETEIELANAEDVRDIDDRLSEAEKITDNVVELHSYYVTENEPMESIWATPVSWKKSPNMMYHLRVVNDKTYYYTGDSSTYYYGPTIQVCKTKDDSVIGEFVVGKDTDDFFHDKLSCSASYIMDNDTIAVTYRTIGTSTSHDYGYIYKYTESGVTYLRSFGVPSSYEYTSSRISLDLKYNKPCNPIEPHDNSVFWFAHAVDLYSGFSDVSEGVDIRAYIKATGEVFDVKHITVNSAAEANNYRIYRYKEGVLMTHIESGRLYGRYITLTNKTNPTLDAVSETILFNIPLIGESYNEYNFDFNNDEIICFSDDVLCFYDINGVLIRSKDTPYTDDKGIKPYLVANGHLYVSRDGDWGNHCINLSTLEFIKHIDVHYKNMKDTSVVYPTFEKTLENVYPKPLYGDYYMGDGSTLVQGVKKYSVGGYLNE